MSFDIDWNKISGDPKINQQIKHLLNFYIESVEFPSYVSNIKITDFQLGEISPKITLKQIDSPMEEFYTAIKNQGYEISDKHTDVQFLIELDYKGDMLIEISAELLLNYPSPRFMRLPVKLTVSNIGIHALCIVAYLQKQLFISFLCDVSDPVLENAESMLDSNGLTIGSRSLERIELIRNIKIQTAIGQQDLGDGTVLRNIGNLEQSLNDILKNIIRKEAAWPSWINLDYNDNVDDDSNLAGESDHKQP